MLKRPIFLQCIRFILCLWIGGSVTSAFAKVLFGEEEEPLEIQSDTANFQENTGQATYKGDVYVRQGVRHLSADVLIVHRTPNGKIDRMTAMGQPARFETRSTSQQTPIYGEANTIKYFAEGNKIILCDHAQLRQEERVIQGPYLIYYLARHLLSSESTDGQKTKVILHNTGGL